MAATTILNTRPKAWKAACVPIDLFNPGGISGSNCLSSKKAVEFFIGVTAGNSRYKLKGYNVLLAQEKSCDQT